MFSFSLICETIATFVPHREQILVKKDSPSSRTTKSSFFSRSANFGNVSPFLVGATNTFSELIHPLIKLPNCVLKFYNLSEALGSFGLLPLRGAGTGFVGVLPLPLIFAPPLYVLHFTTYTAYHREAALKTALEFVDYSVKIWSQVQKITRVFSLKISHRVYQILKEGRVVNRFLTAQQHFWTPWS